MVDHDDPDMGQVEPDTCRRWSLEGMAACSFVDNYNTLGPGDRRRRSKKTGSYECQYPTWSHFVEFVSGYELLVDGHLQSKHIRSEGDTCDRAPTPARPERPAGYEP